MEPLYLQASAKGALPQLKRIIVAFGNKLIMKETLEDALNAIFLGEEGLEKIEKIEEEIERLEQAPIIEGEVDYKLLLENIRDHYNKAQQALQEGDFATYAKEIDKVGELLELVA